MKKFILPSMLVYVHLCFVAGLWLFPLQFLVVGILLGLLYNIPCGMFQHRVVTHKNPVTPFFEKLLIFMSWIRGTGSALGWAGTHRMHHKFSDSDKDPHSPLIQGVARVYFLSGLFNDPKIIKYVPDLLRNKLMVFQHVHYFKGLLLYHAVCLIVLPLHWYWLVAIVPSFVAFLAGGLVNSFCHDKDGSKNIVLFALLFGGEGWHKNHHTDASSPKFNDSFDAGYTVYRWISKKQEIIN